MTTNHTNENNRDAEETYVYKGNIYKGNIPEKTFLNVFYTTPSRLTILLVLLISSILFAGIWYYFVLMHPYTNTTEAPTVNRSESAIALLSPDEAQQARRSLPTQASVAPNENNTDRSATSTQAETASQNSTNNNTGIIEFAPIPEESEPRGSENPGTRDRTDTDVGETSETSTQNDVTISNTSEGSGITFGDVTITNTTETGNPEVVTRTGVVQIPDTERQVLMVTTNAGDMYQINTNSETKFYIGADRIAFSSIRPNDVLEITGTQYENSLQMTAATVTVIATYQNPVIHKN